MDENGQTVEYVYPFVCGLCGYSSCNIDLFHHHFETHGDAVPSSVFHLCEMEHMRNDGSEGCITVGSFSCKACSHTFPTVCNLIEHLDNDSNTQQYIMDLKSKVAVPLTSSYEQVITHNILERRQENKCSSIKTSPLKAEDGMYSTIGKLDYYDDDNNPDDRQSDVSVLQQYGSNTDVIGASDGDNGARTKEKTWLSCKYCGLSLVKRKLKLHEEEHLTYEGNLKYSQENMCRCESCGYVMLKECSMRHVCASLKPLLPRRTRAKKGEPKKKPDRTLTPCPYCSKVVQRPLLVTHIKLVHQVHEPVPCEICRKMFKHKYALKAHKLNTHEAVKKYACKQCPMKCRSRIRLGEHMRRHRNEHNFQCDQCLMKYKFPSDLRRHKRTKHAEDTILFPCELCPKVYSYRDGLGQHMRKSHCTKVNGTESPQQAKVEKRFNCDLCHKKFETSYRLNNHRVIHLGITPFHCDECPQKYSTNISLKKHRYRKHRENITTYIYQCEKCPKQFNYQESLHSHVLRSHKPGDNRLICGWQTCRHKFDCQEELDKHRKLHEGAVEYKCSICDKSYMTSRGLMQHSRNVHHIKPDPQLKHTARRTTDSEITIERNDLPIIDEALAANDHAYVSYCEESSADIIYEIIQLDQTSSVGEDSATITNATIYLDKKPPPDDSSEVLVAAQTLAEDTRLDDRPPSDDTELDLPNGKESSVLNGEQHVCNICEASYTSVAALHEHKHVAHGVIFQCEQCPLKYVSFRSLKRHQRTSHSTETPRFTCDVCPRVFIWPESLKVHKQKTHKPGDSTLFCGVQQCRQRFKTQEELDVHRAVHKERYQCDKCSNSYMHYNGLSQHLRRIHKIMGKKLASVLSQHRVSGLADMTITIDDTAGNGFDKTTDETVDDTTTKAIDKILGTEYVHHVPGKVVVTVPNICRGKTFNTHHVQMQGVDIPKSEEISCVEVVDIHTKTSGIGTESIVGNDNTVEIEVGRVVGTQGKPRRIVLRKVWNMEGTRTEMRVVDASQVVDNSGNKAAQVVDNSGNKAEQIIVKGQQTTDAKGTTRDQSSMHSAPRIVLIKAVRNKEVNTNTAAVIDNISQTH